MEACKRSLEYSRAVRDRRSLMYTKLKPLDSIKKVARAQSSPGIHPSRITQATAKSRALAEDTMEKIHQFELSLKKQSLLPAIGVAKSESSSSASEKLATVRECHIESQWGDSNNLPLPFTAPL